MTRDRYWQDALALQLSAVSGHPWTDWDRLLDAYRVASIDPHHLLGDLCRGRLPRFDPAEAAEVLEATTGYQLGRLAAELAVARDQILPRWLRRRPTPPPF